MPLRNYRPTSPGLRQMTRSTMGTVPGWRKAVVTIAAGQKIELFEAV